MEMMNEEAYWAIIESSLQATQNQEEQQEFLEAELEERTPEEIIGFYLRTVHLLNDTYTSEMWCAGTIMNTRCSDDGFEDFRCWVVSRGRDVYDKAKENPDSLVSEFDADRELYEFELFGYVATEAYEAKTGEDLMDALEDATEEVAEQPIVDFTPIEFNWNRNDPESMKKICPELYQRFRG